MAIDPIRPDALYGQQQRRPGTPVGEPGVHRRRPFRAAMSVVFPEPRWPFLRHYLEMVAAMFAGMILLGPVAMVALSATGHGDVSSNASWASVIMAVTMTVGMVAWMRYRGHRWRVTAEMAAAMNVPVVLVLVLYALGLLSADAGMVVEHVGMLVAMWLAMLYRPDEYGACAHSQRA